MKRIIVIISLLLLSHNSFGQQNYYKLSVGAGAGSTITYGDSKKLRLGLAGNLVADYYFTQFINVGLEMQKGDLKGGDIFDRPFVSNYISFSVNGRVQLGEFVPFSYQSSKLLNLAKGLYLGTGVGLIKNKATVPTYIGLETVTSESREVIIPVNMGININFPNRWGEKRFMVNVNSQVAISLADNLDGDPNPESKVNDLYNFFSIGLRYNFGEIGLTKK